jgi:hypothetical protein
LRCQCAAPSRLQALGLPPLAQLLPQGVLHLRRAWQLPGLPLWLLLLPLPLLLQLR